MNDLMTTSANALTMTSLEIAELTGKRHDNVMTDIRAMLAELELTAPEISGAVNYTVGNGATLTREIYNLDKELTLTLVTGYSVMTVCCGQAVCFVGGVVQTLPTET